MIAARKTNVESTDDKSCAFHSADCSQNSPSMYRIANSTCVKKQLVRQVRNSLTIYSFVYHTVRVEGQLRVDIDQPQIQRCGINPRIIGKNLKCYKVIWIRMFGVFLIFINIVLFVANFISRHKTFLPLNWIKDLSRFAFVIRAI